MTHLIAARWAPPISSNAEGRLQRHQWGLAPVSEGGSAAGGASARAEAAGFPTVLIAVLGLLTLLEGVELVGEGDQSVAAKGVVIHILDVVTGNVAEDVLLLSQDVIDRNGHRGLLVTQELVGQRAVPAPLVGVITGTVTAGGAVVQVGADDQPEGCRIGAVEDGAPRVDVPDS